MSHTSPSAIFCLDWMNAGTKGKTFSNATLSFHFVSMLIAITVFMQRNTVIALDAHVRILQHLKERTAFVLVSRQVGMS